MLQGFSVFSSMREVGGAVIEHKKQVRLPLTVERLPKVIIWSIDRAVLLARGRYIYVL